MLACPVASPGSPSADDTPSSPPEEDETLKLEAVPSSLRMHSNVNFTEEGGVGSVATKSLALRIAVHVPSEMNVLAYRLLDTPQAVTSSGERIRVEQDRSSSFSSRIRSNNKGQDVFHVSVTGVPPTVPADRLKRVTGRVELRLGQDEGEKREFGPMKDLVDTTVAIPGVEGCTLTVTKRRSHYRVGYSGELWRRVKHIAYYRNNGTTAPVPVARVRQYTQRMNTFTDRATRAKKSERGKIAVQFWKESVTRQARFEARDVVLPVGLAEENGETN